MITDQKALEEAMEAAAGAPQMMQGKGGMPGTTDFNNLFRAERESYEILNWKHHLEDVEDAFINKYSAWIYWTYF